MDNIYHLYDDYSDIIEEFGKTLIESRFLDMCTTFDVFIKERNLQNSVKLNTFTLMHAILDYYTDVSRLRKFHKIENINVFKIRAYEISWLLRRKPLQVLEDRKEELVYINEKFVLSYIMNFFSQLLGDEFYDNLSSNNKRMVEGYIDSLYYYLKYRNCGSQALELALLSYGAGVASANREIKGTEAIYTEQSNSTTKDVE